MLGDKHDASQQIVCNLMHCHVGLQADHAYLPNLHTEDAANLQSSVILVAAAQKL